MAKQDSKRGKSLEGHALEAYAHPVVRTLTQAIAAVVGHPIAGVAADNLLMHRREQLGTNRMGSLSDELMKGGATPEQLERRMLEDDLFCTALIKTVEAATKTQREEKIRMFARILLNYDRIVVGNTEDDYEELLRTLDDMSYREWQVLLKLHELERGEGAKRTHPSMPHNYWPEFRGWVAEKGIPGEELLGFLNALTRTGCFHVLGDVHPSAENRAGYTTKKFPRLLAAVSESKP